ncbi:MAG: hypothetical protein EON85_10215 [Brevundimonas sp.]|nr:MAG: hypothetical protein EON85_10215 [Brevundimonas sp.]
MTYPELDGDTPLAASDRLSGGADVVFRRTGDVAPIGAKLIVDCQLGDCAAKSATLLSSANELVAVGITESSASRNFDSQGYPPLKIFVEDSSASLPSLRTTFAAWYVLQRDLRDGYRTERDLTREDAESLGPITTVQLRECVL